MVSILHKELERYEWKNVKPLKLQVVQAKFGGCYPPRSLALVDDILLDLHHSSHHTLPNSIFVN